MTETLPSRPKSLQARSRSSYRATAPLLSLSQRSSSTTRLTELEWTATPVSPLTSGSSAGGGRGGAPYRGRSNTVQLEYEGVKGKAVLSHESPNLRKGKALASVMVVPSSGSGEEGEIVIGGRRDKEAGVDRSIADATSVEEIIRWQVSGLFGNQRCRTSKRWNKWAGDRRRELTDCATTDPTTRLYSRRLQPG